jgi:uncharacterized integral membrane protein
VKLESSIYSSNRKEQARMRLLWQILTMILISILVEVLITKMLQNGVKKSMMKRELPAEKNKCIPPRC